MSVEERIGICRLLEKMNSNQEFSKKLGISEESTFHGEKTTLINYVPEANRYD